MKKYDVFISYAIEDKYTIAVPIAHGLKNCGLKVYFVGEELAPGSSIANTIFDGLEQSSFCVPILSSNYIRKWPAIERNHILRREKKAGKPLVFPVWHHIDQDEVARLFPELADHYAPPAQLGVDAIVMHLNNAISRRKREDVRSYWTKIILCVSALFMVMAVLYKSTENLHGNPPVIYHDNLIKPDN